MSIPEEAALFPRFSACVSAVFATLHATVPVRSIYDDLDGVAEPGNTAG